MRRPPLVLAAIAGLITVAWTLSAASCGSSGGDITIGAVSRATVVEIVDVPASVTARAVATLTSPAEGTLAQLLAAPGASVAKGAVVAVVDSPSARKRLADAKAALAAAKGVGGGLGYVNLTALQDSLDASAQDAFDAARTSAQSIVDEEVRAALLAHIDAAEAHYDSVSNASRKVLRQVQRGIASIGAAVAALGAAQRAQAQAAVDVAQSTVDALTLKAPIAGVVQYARPAASASTDPLAGLLGAVGGAAGGALPEAAGAAGAGLNQNVAGVDDIVAVGDRVSAGTAIVTIVDISEIGLAGEVDETDVLLVSPGVEAEVELDAAPGITYEATVNTVDILPTASVRGGVAYRIRLSFHEDASAGAGLSPTAARPTPRPGMTAVAHLKVRQATDAITVPAAAVFSTDSGDAVWLVRNGRAVLQKVDIGVQGEDLVQVLVGLNPGEQVVVRGTDRVSAGQDLA